MGVSRIVILPSLIVFCTLVSCGQAKFRVARPEESEIDGAEQSLKGNSNSNNCGGHLGEVEDCINEIMTDVMRIDFNHIGQGCCKVAMEIGQDCNIQILPFNPINDPFWGPLIIDYCTAKP